jgi:hypothetical protein
MRLVEGKLPTNSYNRFTLSDRSNKILYPKFFMSKIKNNNFVFNTSKILIKLFVRTCLRCYSSCN